MAFTPFDDNQTPARVDHPTGSGKANYDTSGWDNWRQGVEITLEKFLYGSSMPRMWDGNLDLTHQIPLVTYGQALNFIDGNPLGLESKFEDLPLFNPVAYITLGPDYPLPIVFNDGPMKSDEAQIEPLTIPFKMRTNEGPYYVHGVHASLEDGSNLDNLNGDTSRVSQFVDFDPPLVVRPFLDQGGGELGGVRIDQYIAIDMQRIIRPFDDTGDQVVLRQLSNQSPEFQTAIAPLQINNRDNLNPSGQRSMPSGYTYSGPNAALYGTDSVTFGGWMLG